jgi:hypothetical protein
VPKALSLALLCFRGLVAEVHSRRPRPRLCRVGIEDRQPTFNHPCMVVRRTHRLQSCHVVGQPGELVPVLSHIALHGANNRLEARRGGLLLSQLGLLRRDRCLEFTRDGLQRCDRCLDVIHTGLLRRDRCLDVLRDGRQLLRSKAETSESGLT